MLFRSLSGDLIKYWGENEFIMPHGLSVDKEDNIWVTDVGAHQIKKFSGNGELLLSIGKRGVSGNDEITFDFTLQDPNDLYRRKGKKSVYEQ